MYRQIWTVFTYELRRNLRRRGYLFATFGIPTLVILAVLSFQVISNLDRDSDDNPLEEELDLRAISRAGYVDLSGELGDAGELAAVLVAYDDEQTARAALNAGEVDVYYVIAEDYLATGHVTLVIPHLSFDLINDVLVTRLAFDALAAQRLAPGSDPNLLQRLQNPSNIERININASAPASVTQNEDSSFLMVYLFALTLLGSTLLTNGYLMQSVIEEKETRLIEILLSSMRPIELLTGKIFAMGLLGLFQAAVWVGAFALLLRLTNLLNITIAVIDNLYLPTKELPLMLIYFALSYLLLAAGFGTVGALSNSMREGPQLSAVFTLPMVIPLWALSLFLTNPDGNIPTILSLIPITAPLAMVMRLVLTSVPAWQIIVSILLLMSGVVGMLWLAGRLFRVQTLLAGQRPRLRNIPKLILQ